MNEKVEKICFQIIKIGTILILFLPLLVYRPVLFPYVFSKAIVFQILVEIIFVAWLFLAIYGSRKYRPHWRHPIVIALSIFMGILILTSLTGADFYKSFWSYQERMTGIATMLHFYALFIVLISIFKNWKDWLDFIWTSLICSFLVGLYGLGQKIGLEFLLKGEDVRMSATLGNPIFLAVYAMLHIFLAGLLLFYEQRKLWRMILMFLLIFNVAIMFLAASRGVVAAFGLSLLLFFVFLILSLSSKRIKFTLSFLLIIFVISFIAIQFPWAKSIVSKAPYFIRRLANLKSGVQERIISWQAGLSGFQERPVFGWGWESYNIIFNKHYNPIYLRKGQENTWFDRSHNQIIDMLALTGILGILTYLSVWGVLFWLLFRKYREKIREKIRGPTSNGRSDLGGGDRARISIVILGLMFIAYFIQNLFVFDTPAPLIVFYFSLGLVYFITQRDANPSPNALGEGRMHTNDTNENNNKLPLPVLIFLIIIFLPLAIYKLNVEPFQQSRLAIRGVHTSKVDLKSGFYWYQKALEKQTFANPEIRTQLAKTVSEQYAQKNPDTQTVVAITEFAIKEYKKSVEEHPRDARHWLYLGQLYNLGARYNDSYIDKAEEALNKALELSPKRQQVYFELARIEIIQKNNDKAIKLLEKAVELDPEVKDSQFNLAAAYLEDGRYREGVEATEKAWELNYRWWKNVAFMQQLAKAYIELEDYNKAIRQYKWSLYITPEDAGLYFKLANLYIKKGDIINAKESAKKALELDSSLKDQIDEFLKQLEQ